MAMVPGLDLLPNSEQLKKAIVEGRLVLRHLDSGHEYNMVQHYVRDTDYGFPRCKGKLAKPVQVYSVQRTVEMQTYVYRLEKMLLWYPLMMDWEADVLCTGIQYSEAHFYDTVSVAAHHAYKHEAGNNATLLLCEVALDDKLTMYQKWSDYKEPWGELKNIPDEEVVHYMGQYNRVPSLSCYHLTNRWQKSIRASYIEANYYGDYVVKNMDRITMMYLVVLNGYTEEENNRPPNDFDEFDDSDDSDDSDDFALMI